MTATILLGPITGNGFMARPSAIGGEGRIGGNSTDNCRSGLQNWGVGGGAIAAGGHCPRRKRPKSAFKCAQETYKP